VAFGPPCDFAKSAGNRQRRYHTPCLRVTPRSSH
jgi:hypothetical protein